MDRRSPQKNCKKEINICAKINRICRYEAWYQEQERKSKVSEPRVTVLLNVKLELKHLTSLYETNIKAYLQLNKVIYQDPD